MERDIEDLNRYQIIRKDAKNCFVESKSDNFKYSKAHLEFSHYDLAKPSGQRQTNHVHIYIDYLKCPLFDVTAMKGTFINLIVFIKYFFEAIKPMRIPFDFTHIGVISIFVL